MDLFEYRNVIFDKAKFSKVEDSIKKKHYFMLLRFFSIRYPVEASQLSQKVILLRKTRKTHFLLFQKRLRTCMPRR